MAKVRKSGQKPNNWFFSLILLVPAFIFLGTSYSDQPQLDETSMGCLKCHGLMRYTLVDPETGDSVSLKMYEELRIDIYQYVTSTHGSFSCIDCHSTDYETHPHPISVKFEPVYTCLDCHGNNEVFAEYNFNSIAEEYEKSVHSEHLVRNFSCWSCHNPHTYRNTARKGGKIIDIVAYNNSMCLGCHGEISHYAVLIQKQLTNMLSKHDWLPNQSLHFRKVRCIDCHAATNENILVAHHILPAKQAVKNCVECHSTNSILLASLYKHQVIERRNKYGFFNAGITSDAYIIGANRNYYFNVISIIIFGMVILGIIIHATFRYIHKRKKSKPA